MSMKWVSFIAFSCNCIVSALGPAFPTPPAKVSEVSICFLARYTTVGSSENLQAFYSSGEGFFENGLNSESFTAQLQDIDLDLFINATDATLHGIENGCQYFVSKATSSDTTEIASASIAEAILTTSCSATSKILSNTRAFPYFVRSVGATSNEADCLVAFANSYALQNVAIVSSETDISQELLLALVPKLSKESIMIRSATFVDGTESSFAASLDGIASADVVAVLVLGDGSNTDGLFEMARARNLTTNGMVWITSEMYSFYGASLSLDDPERRGLEFAVGSTPNRGQVTYGNPFASFEAYCYDMTEAVLRGIDLAIAQHGFENIDVYNVRRQIDGLVFNGQTGETYFDETGIRESANFSFISFEETSVRYVGKCSGIVYSKTAEVPLPNNETLRVPTTLKLQTNFWKSLPITGPSPSRRTGTLVARSIEHSHIYAFGGAGPNSQAHNDLYLFDVNELAWKQVPTTTDRPRERVSGALVAVRDTLLLYGGITITNNILDDMYWFDIPTATWTEVDLSLMDRPVPRRDFAYVEMQDGFIIFGGYSPYADNPFFNDVWEYKITENVWMLHTPSDFNQVAPLVASPMLAVTNTWDTLFLFGGTTDYNSDEAATYSFDLRTGVWSMVNAESILAPARSGAAIAYYGNSLVVGIGTSHAMSRDLTDFYRLGLDLCDGVTCEGWRKIEMREFSRSGTGNCPVFGGWMYCFGGVVDMDYTNDLNRWRLRSVDNSTHLVSMSDIVVTVSDTSYTIALAKSVISSSNNIFVYGGIEAPGIFSTKLSDYDVNQHDFDQFGSGTAPLRMYHATTSFGGFMVAFGGQNEYGQIVNEMHFIPISATQAPPAYPVEHTEVWPAARSKHVMVTINTEELFMYGGANEIDEHYDSWIFHVTTRMWTLLHEPGSVERTQRVMDFALEQEASFPVHNRGGVAVLVGDFIIYLGGETWSSTPTDSIYAFSLLSNSWKRLDANMLQPAVYHVAVAVGPRIIIHGGKSGYRVLDDLYYMQVTSMDKWPTLGPPELFPSTHVAVVPKARAYHWGNVVGHGLIIGGGLTGSSSYLDGSLLNDVHEYVFGPVCTREEVASGDINDCWLCGPGTYHNSTMTWSSDRGREGKYGLSCAVCMAGAYSDMAGTLDCVRCPTGYQSSEGNVGSGGCFPCLRGYKMSMKYCSECDVGDICPMGSDAPLVEGTREYEFYLRATGGYTLEEQPSTLDTRNEDIQEAKESVVTVCLTLAGLLCALILILSTMREGRRFVSRADNFAVEHHDTTVDGVLRETKNAFGGFFFLQYMVLSVMVVLLTATPFMIMNEYEVRTKEPRTMILLGQDEVETLATTFTVALHFLSGTSCVCDADECLAADEAWVPCSEDVILSSTGIEGYPMMQCRMGVRLCEMRVSCENCAFVKSLQPKLLITLDVPQVMTDAFTYYVNSTSGYPGQYSAIAGSAFIHSGQDMFRGYDPSVISVEVTETLYEDFVNDVFGTGALVSSLGIEYGSVVDTNTFTKEQGLGFAVNFIVNGNAVRIVRREVFTPITIISSAASVVSAFTGAFALLMRFSEHLCGLLRMLWSFVQRPAVQPI
eukprot:Rmarinus@m.3405